MHSNRKRRAFFALWALLLCLAEIGGALLAAVKKRFRSVLPPLLLHPLLRECRCRTSACSPAGITRRHRLHVARCKGRHSGR